MGTFPSYAYARLSSLSSNRTGLLVVGGHKPEYLPGNDELWASDLPPCALPTLPRAMWGNTVDVIGDTILACHWDYCDQLTSSGWQPGPQLTHARHFHASAVTGRGVLLVGGAISPFTAELLPIENDHLVPSLENNHLVTSVENNNSLVLTLEHEWLHHCTIEVSSSTILLTGGWETETMVLEISNLDGNLEQVRTRRLPDLLTGRDSHASGTYMLGGIQRLIVAGGSDTNGDDLRTTEVMDLTDGGTWRKSNKLPERRYAGKGANLAGKFHITGGWVEDVNGESNDVLAWEPVTESWELVGHLINARSDHGVAEVDIELVELLCNRGVRIGDDLIN